MSNLANNLATFLDAPPYLILSLLLGATITIVVATRSLIINYSLAPRQPWKGFRLISIEGETAQRSFALHGRVTLEKGLKEVCNSFSVPATVC